MILQVLANGIIAGSVYAIVALGFGIVYKATRVFHFAHGAVYTVSAYAFYSLSTYLSIPAVFSIVLALSIGTLLGTAIESLVYYPLYNKKAPFTISFISSMGIYLFLINLIATLFGNELRTMQPDLEKTYYLASIILTRTQVIDFLVFIVVSLSFYIFMKKSRLGYLIRAFSNNPLLATILGLHIRKIRLTVFIIGSLLASLAGLLVVLDIGIDPNIGFSVVFICAVAVIIGGVDFLEGAILGAFILGIVQNITIWKLSTRWQEGITFGILILFLFLRPNGVLNYKKRIEEISR